MYIYFLYLYIPTYMMLILVSYSNFTSISRSLKLPVVFLHVYICITKQFNGNAKNIFLNINLVFVCSSSFVYINCVEENCSLCYTVVTNYY